jgi:hypothetical protein
MPAANRIHKNRPNSQSLSFTITLTRATPMAVGKLELEENAPVLLDGIRVVDLTNVLAGCQDESARRLGRATASSSGLSDL